MKTKTIFTIFVIVIYLNTFGQRNSFELTFTAINNVSNVQLDSIKIINRTLKSDTTLYWPDTVLVLDSLTRINEINRDIQNFTLNQNYPNPVKKQTTVSLFIPQKENVNIIITNIFGQPVFKNSFVLENGKHYFRFAPGLENIYFVTAQYKNLQRSIKVLKSPSASYGKLLFEHIGSDKSDSHFKSSESRNNFAFFLSNELLYIGYNNEIHSGIIDTPNESQVYTFQFATNIPCPDAPTVTHEGIAYNTIQIYSQCWLKENLNIGTMILGHEWSSDNNIIEKYCLINSADSCLKYGGLYSWWEMMQYAPEEGAKGICPAGWHLPTDTEWKILEGSADSQYEIGSVTWDIWGHRGFDSGRNLKSESGWNYGSNGTDLFDFTALPGGRKWGNSSWNIGTGTWWSSTHNSNNDGAWHRILTEFEDGIERKGEDSSLAISVRCIKNKITK